ncbi:hypothetical protein MXE68_27685, partial [Escherichia coli]|nr:hypothetical protein [Escherichia coli]
MSVFITVISGHDKPQPSGCLLEANLAYQSNQDAETLMKQLGQINDELGALLDSLENHTPVIRK